MAKRKKEPEKKSLTVTLPSEGSDVVEMHFPYHPDITDWVKTLPGRKYIGAEKYWTVPVDSAEHVLAGIETIQSKGIDVVLGDGVKEALEKGAEEAKKRRQEEGLPTKISTSQNVMTLVKSVSDPSLIEVRFSYNYSLVEWVKKIPGRKFDGERKVWTVPMVSAKDLYSGVAKIAEQGFEVVWADGLEQAVGDEARETEARVSREIAASRAGSVDESVAAEIPCPDGLEYMPFQKAGIAYAMRRRNTLFGDEMGLGKTIQAIGVVNTDGEARRVAVLCPASLKLNWKKEIGIWSLRPPAIHVAFGTPSAATWEEVFADVEALPRESGGERTEYLILNYDIVGRWRDLLLSAGVDVMVMDESHYLKNPKVKRTQNVLGKWDRDPEKVVEALPAKRFVALTGTPIPNRPVEAWPVLHALDPQTFRSFREFANRYCDAYNDGYGLKCDGASNLDELQDKLRATVMIRRKKNEVLKELPAKRRAVVPLPAPESVLKRERQALEKIEAERVAQAQRLFEAQVRLELAKAAGEKEFKKARREFQEATQALRDSGQMEFRTISKVRHETAQAKAPFVSEYIKDCVEQGGKIICFAHHLDVIEQIASAFGDAAVVITGETPVVKRQAVVERFQTDPECKVFVGNIKAAGVGITLTASSHVIFAELDMVPGNLEQAEDRAHRIGQQESVLVQHLIFDGSIDVDLAKMVIEKQKVIHQALDGEHEPVVHEEIEVPEIHLAADVTEFRAYEAVLPRRERVDFGVPATRSVKVDEIEALAVELTDEEITVAHQGLQMVAQVCDGAVAKDGHGFNGCDAAIGKRLALEDDLTPKQAALGMTILRKYHRQLSPEVVETVKAAMDRAKEKAKSKGKAADPDRGAEASEEDDLATENGVSL